MENVANLSFTTGVSKCCGSKFNAGNPYLPRTGSFDNGHLGLMTAVM